jgi:hypothetical protein
MKQIILLSLLAITFAFAACSKKDSYDCVGNNTGSITVVNDCYEKMTVKIYSYVDSTSTDFQSISYGESYTFEDINVGRVRIYFRLGTHSTWYNWYANIVQCSTLNEVISGL